MRFSNTFAIIIVFICSDQPSLHWGPARVYVTQRSGIIEVIRWNPSFVPLTHFPDLSRFAAAQCDLSIPPVCDLEILRPCAHVVRVCTWVFCGSRSCWGLVDILVLSGIRRLGLSVSQGCCALRERLDSFQ